MNPIRHLCGSLLLILLLAACGQSGPLYLPGNPSEVQDLQSPSQNARPTDGEEDASKDDDEG